MAVMALAGSALESAMPELARLRINVFRDYPYLYDGSEEYESRYLAGFAEARDAIIVAAHDADGRIIGCATGSALDAHHAAFAAPLTKAGIDLASTFYFGESVLVAEYRGRGLGHAFFDHRESHALGRGYRRACFCAVVRSAADPRRPSDYSPLDAFWTRRGYRRLEGALAKFEWRELGDASETEKLMQVWLRELA